MRAGITLKQKIANQLVSPKKCLYVLRWIFFLFTVVYNQGVYALTTGVSRLDCRIASYSFEPVVWSNINSETKKQAGQASYVFVEKGKSKRPDIILSTTGTPPPCPECIILKIGKPKVGHFFVYYIRQGGKLMGQGMMSGAETPVYMVTQDFPKGTYEFQVFRRYEKIGLKKMGTHQDNPALPHIYQEEVLIKTITIIKK